MRKILGMTVVALAAVALAAPASAVEISGFNQINGWASNGRGSSGNFVDQKGAEKSNSFVEQRARLKFAFGDEKVKFVYQGEIDSLWGVNSFDSDTYKRTSAGGLGTDGVNVETKHLYLWYKGPAGLDVTAGLVGLVDPYAGVLYDDDMAAISFSNTVGSVDLTLAFAKLYEGVTNTSDDTDVAYAIAKFSPAKDMSLGVNFHFINDRRGLDTSEPTDGIRDVAAVTKLFIPGVDFNGTFGKVKASAFAFYQFGDTTANDVKIAKYSGYALDARADVAVGPGNLFAEALYISGDKQGSNLNDLQDDKYKGIATVSPFFYRTNLQILLTNGDDLTSGSGLIGVTDYANGYNGQMSNEGYGLFLLAGGYDQKISDKLSVACAAGWMQAAVKPVETRRNKDMGAELGGTVTYNIQKGLDMKLGLAYAWLGEFFNRDENTDTGVTVIDHPVEIWQAGYKLIYSF